jgi:hypothetical protein
MRLRNPFKARARYGGTDGPVSNLGPNSQTVALANSQFTIPAYYNRIGITVTSDAAGTGTVYGLAGTGTPSQTNHHFSLAPGGSWDGEITQALWSGPVTLFSAGTIKVGVWEV